MKIKFNRKPSELINKKYILKAIDKNGVIKTYGGNDEFECYNNFYKHNKTIGHRFFIIEPREKILFVKRMPDHFPYVNDI